MSDTFDHEGDAWASLEDEDEFPFVADPLFYHRKYRFTAIPRESEKAYLMTIDGADVWVPKSICRRLDLAAGTVWLHHQTMLNMAAQRAAQAAKEQVQLPDDDIPF